MVYPELTKMVADLREAYAQEEKRLMEHPDFNVNQRSLLQRRKLNIDEFESRLMEIPFHPFHKQQSLKECQEGFNEILAAIKSIESQQ